MAVTYTAMKDPTGKTFYLVTEEQAAELKKQGWTEASDSEQMAWEAEFARSMPIIPDSAFNAIMGYEPEPEVPEPEPEVPIPVGQGGVTGGDVGKTFGAMTGGDSDYWNSEKPYLTWQRMLEPLGISQASNFGKWLNNQYQSAFANYLAKSVINFGTETPTPEWGQGPISYTPQAGLWDKFQQAYQGLDPSHAFISEGGPLDIYSDQGAGNVYQMAANAARTQGLPAIIAKYALANAGNRYKTWEALHDPEAPGTTGTGFFDYLNKIFGL